MFLHLHPVRTPKSGIRVRYTWCMGGLTFFIFMVEVVTGIMLMFYYRPTLEYAYTDIINLGREQFIDELRDETPAVEVRMLKFAGGRINLSATVMDEGQDVIAGKVIRRVLERHS